MIKAYRYRIYPTQEQQLKLEWTFRRCCELYNAALEERIGCYQKTGQTLTAYTQALNLKNLKAEDCRPEFKTIDSQVLKNVLTRLELSYKGFFARVKKGQAGNKGFPKFLKSRYYQSITYPTANKNGIQGVKLIAENKLKLNGVGVLRFKQHMPLPENLRTLTVKKDVNKWYAIFTVDVAAETLLNTNKIAAVHLGLNSFATIYDGLSFAKLDKLEPFKESERKLRIANRKVARRKKGSSGRAEALRIRRKWYQKMREQRDDYHKQLIAYLFANFDTVIIESWGIADMIEGAEADLGKRMTDAAWGMFLMKLKTKSKEFDNKFVIELEKHFPSSMLCSSCKQLNKALRTQKTWICPSCGLKHDREENASKNVFNEGLDILTKQAA